MAIDHNYFAVIRSWTIIDPINGQYKSKYYVMNQSTIGASTQFWHEGMTSGTPLSSAPADNVLLEMPLIGISIPILQQSLQTQCQTLAARLTAMNVTPLTISVGTITPVTVTY